MGPQALVQALLQENTDSFAELVESLNLAATRVGELLSSHEASLDSQAEGRINRLEQEVAQLHRRSAELIRLADMRDPVCFLKVTNIRGLKCHWLKKTVVATASSALQNFLTMEPLGQREETGESAPPQEVVVAAIRSTTKRLQESVKELCGCSLEEITAIRPSILSASLIFHLCTTEEQIHVRRVGRRNVDLKSSSLLSEPRTARRCSSRKR